MKYFYFALMFLNFEHTDYTSGKNIWTMKIGAHTHQLNVFMIPADTILAEKYVPCLKIIIVNCA